MLTTVLHIILAMFAASYAAEPESLSKAARAAFLSAHNELRNSFGLQKLFWNLDLAKFAKKYGSKCLWKHSVDRKYGENLFASYPKIGNNEEIARNAIKSWADELVWRDTKQVGCAIVHCDDFMENYVVCEYSPPGNIRGTKPY